MPRRLGRGNLFAVNATKLVSPSLSLVVESKCGWVMLVMFLLAFIAASDEKVAVAPEAGMSEAPPIIVKVSDTTPRVDKWKSVAGPVSPRCGEADEAPGVQVAMDFVRLYERRIEHTSIASMKMAAEVPFTLEGLDPRLRPEVIEKIRARIRAEDYKKWDIDPSRASNPVPNVVNLKSVLLDNSEVGSHLLESMVIPRDRHLLWHCKDSTEVFAQRFCQGLAVVSLPLTACSYFMSFYC